ncbi:WD repeat-containing protein 47-like isoform X2 [Antedon mediterranea]|uniref:WD repeat-containing protein 47-like isoform X2 n=1 Tax=Antedon mediterranea TaxID=105859 RepID=UPI003AF76F88
MVFTKIAIKESDILKLVLDFLSSRELLMSMRTVEKESGVVNGLFSDDVLFLRHLILDGQWDDVLEFIQPLEGIPTFEENVFRYKILKHKYLEMLCMQSEDFQNQMELSAEEVASCLKELEPYCPSKEDYNNLCLLLTIPRLADHVDFKNWSPSIARMQCFNDVCPLVSKFLPVDKHSVEGDFKCSSDRLCQLLMKGLLFEACVDFCQQKATSRNVKGISQTFDNLLNGTSCDDADLSLLSWLQSIPKETFGCPFEQRSLEIECDKLLKPKTSWSEQILTPMTPTPIRRGSSPSPSTPTLYRGRPWSAGPQRLSQSLTPSMEALISQARREEELRGSLNGNPLSHSFSNFHMGGGSASKPTPLPKVTETVERSPPDTTRISNRASPILRQTPQPIVADPVANSMHNMYQEHQMQREQLRQQMEAQERRREALQRELLDQSSAIGSASVIEGPQHGTSTPYQSTDSRPPSTGIVANNRINKNMTPVPNQELPLTPPHQATYSITPLGLNSSTPKCNRMDKMATPEPDASPVLPTAPASIPLLKSGRPQHTPPPMQNLDTSVGEIIGKGGNIVNLTYISQGKETPQLSKLDTLSLNPSLGFSKSTNTDVAGGDTPKMLHLNSEPLHVEIGGGVDMHSDVIPNNKSEYIPLTTLEDVQAIRAISFNTSGSMYAVGSNSKTLRVCAYPSNISTSPQPPRQPEVLFKRNRHHKGSIYCVTWNHTDDIIATGSNDKLIKLLRFNAEKCNAEGPDTELSMHDGTIRDLTFQPNSPHGTVLLSGGAGNCSIYVTECNKGRSLHSLSGHTGHVLSLFGWSGHLLASGSEDKTVRFWDLRVPKCINIIGSPGSDKGQGSSVASVCIDPSGRLLASGQENATTMLYDIRGGRVLQTYQAHTDQIRTVRFSPNAYYLLSGSYDSKVVLCDLQGDLTKPLPSAVAATHQDKIIQCRWHPNHFTFLTSSADRTATLWNHCNS